MKKKQPLISSFFGEKKAKNVGVGSKLSSKIVSSNPQSLKAAESGYSRSCNNTMSSEKVKNIEMVEIDDDDNADDTEPKISEEYPNSSRIENSVKSVAHNVVDLENGDDTVTEAEIIEKKQENSDTTNTTMSSFKYQKSSPSIYLNSSSKQLLHSKFSAKLTPSKRRLSTKSASPAKKAKSLTPLEAQIVDLKKQHPDKILAINVGYKYKFCGPDAPICSSILNIMMIPGKTTLDGSNPQDKYYDKLAYCTVPDTRLPIHLKRLLSHGHKVGIVEQTENAAIKSMSSSRNKLFERTLTNVYTSATYIDDEVEDTMFGTKGGDSIAAIVEDVKKNLISLVCVSPVNGEIVYDVFEDDYARNELETRLQHLTPSEFVVPDQLSKLTMNKIQFFQKSSKHMRITTVSINDTNLDFIDYLMSSAGFDKQDPDKTSIVTFAQSLEPSTQLGCHLLAQYLQEFGLDRCLHIKQNYYPFKTKASMLLNAGTLIALEIFKNSTTNTNKGSLLELMDHTKTIFGFRLLKKWISRPLIDRGQIEERLQSIADILEGVSQGNLFIESMAHMLSELGDLEKSVNRLHYRRSNRKDIYIFLKTLDKVVSTILSGSKNAKLQTKSSLLVSIFTQLLQLSKDLKPVVKSFLEVIGIQAAMTENDTEYQTTQFFNSNFNDFPQITEKRQVIREVEILLHDQLKSIRKVLGRPQMEFKTVLKDEYLIEVTKITARKVPSDWIKINDTKSLVRFRSPEINKLLKQLKYERARLIELCEELFVRFCEQIDSHYLEFNTLIKNLATMDCLFSLAACSKSSVEEYCRPQFIDQRVISVKNGRNPIIESLVSTYIPNDIIMKQNRARALILTGPNMGGKTCYVKQIALIVIMAQIGSYVPADAAVLGVFDSVFTRMGFDDNIMKGESTFQVEMSECCSIIKNCTSNSLVILDEVGRGTGTTDGVSIAYSILDYLVGEAKTPFVLFITHYTEICEIENEYDGVVKNLHMDYKEVDEESPLSKVVFLYKAVAGHSQNSYGLNVAQLCSIPEHVVKQALEISKDYEQRKREWRAVGWGIEIGKFLKEGDGDIEHLAREEEYI